MNKALWIALLSIASLTAHAESFSGGSLNYSIDGGSIIAGTSSLNALNYASDGTTNKSVPLTVFNDSVFDTQLSQGSSVAKASTDGFNSSVSAYTEQGYASADLTTFFQINYTAGQTLTFSATVDTFGLTKTANSYGQISYSVQSNGAFFGETFSDQVSSADGVSKLISLTYRSDENQILQLSTHLYSEAAQTSVSPVPEPMTYTMMLAGLGLVAFSTKRRKNS